MEHKPRKIKQIVFVRDADGQESIVPRDGQVIYEEHQNMGDYGLLFAAIYDNEGKLMSRWNMKYLEGVIYDNLKELDDDQNNKP